jgi:hypothetical protein
MDRQQRRYTLNTPIRPLPRSVSRALSMTGARKPRRWSGWGDGRWIKELTLPPGVYEYRIVADGEWKADPLAREANPNPFGGLNSVLEVKESSVAKAESKRFSP